MKKKLVSIIVPIYNSEKYLERCICSLTNQTYKNIEIFLIDDGSIDNSPKICDKWSKKDKRIKVIHKKNGGVNSARNIGIELMKGDYVSFVDSDDCIDSQMIEILVKNMLDFDVDLSICGYSIIDKNSTISNKFDSILMKSIEDFHKNSFYYKGYLWNKLFKSEIVKKVPLDLDIYLCEDELYITKYVEMCSSFYYDSRCLYNYYIYDNSLSNVNVWNEKKITIIEARKRELEILKKYGFDVYYNYYYSDFLSKVDIYYRYDKSLINKKDLNDMCNVILKSSLYSFKIKIKVFCNCYFFGFYSFLSKIRKKLIKK